jgi:hypothetical protein
VKGGESIFIRTPNDKRVLIDGGQLKDWLEKSGMNFEQVNLPHDHG